MTDLFFSFFFFVFFNTLKRKGPNLWKKRYFVSPLGDIKDSVGQTLLKTREIPPSCRRTAPRVLSPRPNTRRRRDENATDEKSLLLDDLFPSEEEEEEEDRRSFTTTEGDANGEGSPRAGKL